MVETNVGPKDLAPRSFAGPKSQLDFLSTELAGVIANAPVGDAGKNQ